MESIGWLSAACLMLCGVPEAWKSYKQGFSDLSDGLIILWLLGELLGSVYVVSIGKAPLIANFLVNLCMVAIIFKYKYWPQKRLPESKLP